MKIQNSNSANLSCVEKSANLSPGANSRAAGLGTDSAAGPSDDVRISTLSRGLAALEAHSSEHASKIVRLSDAVASGRYQVDARAVSDNLIEAHLGVAA